MTKDSAATPPSPGAMMPENAAELVIRSNVPPGKSYSEYRKYLRFDFYHSCAYCTMSEAEAQAIRFTIDHYEPRTSRPDLENEYYNLMYCCDQCNIRKGNRCPPPDARAQGLRFFRPDEDVFGDHFERTDLRVEGKTNTGKYSIDALDLNRQALRTLRRIRRKLTECDQLVTEGVLALRKYPIDQLPPEIKGRAVRAIQQASTYASTLREKIDSVLRDYSKSPLIDEDEEMEERRQLRTRNLKQAEGLFAGSWRASNKKR